MNQRILIFNVNWRGDVLFSTPAIKAIRKRYPDAYLTCIVPPRCRELLEQNPSLNEIIPFDEKGAQKGILAKLRFIHLLRRERFDQAFIFHRSFTRALLVWLAGIPKRIGYSTKRRGVFLTTKVPLPLLESLHKVEYFLGIVRAEGIGVDSNYYEFHVGEEARSFASQFLASHGVKDNDFLVIFNPGGNWDPKRWPVERYAELGDRLVESHNAKVLITGAAKDGVLADNIIGKMSKKPITSCGKTNLLELGALLERADLVISGDSGPMHMAVAIGTRVIALFGPTSLRITGPYGRGDYKVIWKDVGCEVPCYDRTCKENRCMKAITVDDVLGALR